MRKLVAAVAVAAAALTVGYTGIQDNTVVTCDGYQIAIFDLAGEQVAVTADGVAVFDGERSAYLTVSDSWDRVKRNHRLVITVDGDRTVFTVKGCPK